MNSILQIISDLPHCGDLAVLPELCVCCQSQERLHRLASPTLLEAEDEETIQVSHHSFLLYLLYALSNTHIQYTLQLALDSVRFEFTLKMRLNRIMTERPNICYIFVKLSVQGCQTYHSYVSIPFNSAPAHSTRPHNGKRSSLCYHFSWKSWKLASQKLLLHAHFWCNSIDFLFSQCQGHVLGQSHTKPHLEHHVFVIDWKSPKDLIFLKTKFEKKNLKNFNFFFKN